MHSASGAMTSPQWIEEAAVVVLSLWVAVAAGEVSPLDRAVVVGSTAIVLVAARRFEARMLRSPALVLLRPASSQGLCLGTALPACTGLAVGALCVRQGYAYGHALANAAAAASVMAAVICASLAAVGTALASPAAALAGFVYILLVSGGAAGGGAAPALAFPAALAASWLAALRLSPRSFTVGESLCVSSLLATLAHPCLAALCAAAWRGLRSAGVTGVASALLGGCAPSGETEAQFSARAALCAVALVASSCASLALVLAAARDRNRRRRGSASAAAAAVALPAAGAALPSLTAALGCNPVLWIVGSLATHPARLHAVAAWAVLLAAAVPCVGRAASRGGTAQILLRKLFHALVVLLFVPGTLAQPLLQCLAYAVGASLLLLAESVRLGAGKGAGATLDRFAAPLRDARDSGPLLLTPLYLLVGCALPAWAAWVAGLFEPRQVGVSASEAAFAARALAGGVLGTVGVLVLGVGDAVAAAAGRAMGSVRWPGGRKTVEGSLCGIVATAAAGAVCMAAHRALLPSLGDEVGAGGLGHGVGMGVGVGLVGAFAVEAATDQIDNLVMPMYAMAAVAAGLRPG